ncbi:unnamed protein product [Adineta steineri]|uniref:Uncharacterized protein n=1 Tax=Adineta steineri TaxID=433720 RepID=A0A814XU14_9BILA|nr:unnamed protein product [Adineta steineri]CAF3926650.1 unnamed protein product [Adineta steineri]
MTKYKSYTDVKQNMAEYKMRTAYVTPIQIHRLTTNLDSPRSARQHVHSDRSHSKADAPKASNHPEEHINQNTQMQQTPQTQTQLNNHNHETILPPIISPPTAATTTTTTTKKNSRCTIL